LWRVRVISGRLFVDDQGIDDDPDACPYARVVATAGAVVVPGANVDHRVELDPVPPFLFGIEVDPPEIPLRGTVGEKHGVVVRVEVATDRHDSPRHVHDRLDPVAELLFRQPG